MPVARVTNIVQTIEYLKKRNIWIAGTDSTGEKPYFESDLTGAIALVIGSEEKAWELVREELRFCCQYSHDGEHNFLNAAVAGAIVIYEILRQGVESRPDGVPSCRRIQYHQRMGRYFQHKRGELLEDCRDKLASMLSNYQGVRKSNIILVFDAHLKKGRPGKRIFLR